MSHQQPHQGPQPYQPPTPPKKPMSGLAITGIVIGGIFALLIVIGVIGAAAGGGDTKTDDSKAAVETSSSAPAKDKTEAPKPKPNPAAPAPVQIAAKKTTFSPGVLHDGGAYTSVSVTITNNSHKWIDINPLYFTITDTNGTKHSAELAVDENQIDTVKLAPGENTNGAITGKGAFTPKYVTYVDGLLGQGVRADVS